MNTSIERVGVYSILINLFLLSLNLVLAVLSGSLALAAETTHNLADLSASGAVLAGLKLSQRTHRAFPYGLYKVENVVALIIAFFIFFTAYEVAKEAVFTTERQVVIRPLMLLGVGVAALVPWLFSRYELRVGRAVNSPSLIADAKEFQAHVLSSGVIFAALIGQWIGWPLDRPAAMLIIGWIVYVGWETLTNGMRVLLDASVDADTLAQVRSIIVQQPAVVEIKSLLGRNAGRYRFIETALGLRVQALAKAHQISQEIETAIRAAIPHVERVLVHIEPAQKPLRRIAVPLADRAGTTSLHFGTAPYFALTDVQTNLGKTENLGKPARQLIIENPHADDPRGRGIKVAQWLLEQQVDVLVTADDVQDKGPGYALGDAGVSVIVNTARTLESAVAASLTLEPRPGMNAIP